MKNVGLFSSLFIERLKAGAAIDDAARGRMATLAHSRLVYKAGSADKLWDSFLKLAVSYLEFVPPPKAEEGGVYPLYDDFGYRDCVTVLYLVPDGEQLDLPEVGRFYPAKLVSQLRKRGLSWGILTNGSNWRLYSTKTSRPYEDFVELDLSATLADSNESEYGLFERFFHKDSFLGAKKGKDDKELPTCRLDVDRSESETVLDTLVKKPFLAQVDEVLQYICNGFIYDTRKAGDEYTEEERKEIFASAVKLIYRSLFLFYAEARRLLPSDPEKAELYRRHSIRSLCEQARAFHWGERQDTDQYDLWQNLKGLTSAVNDGDPEYGIMGYNGGLFDDDEERFLRDHRLRNDFLARALYLLAYVEPYDNERKSEYAIPYEDLEVRHLGELYENILEFTVVLSDADRIRRRTKKGVEVVLASGTQRQAGDSFIKKGEVYFGESALERKQTGSYYTPESLVRFLNQKSIVAPLNERFDTQYRARFADLIAEARTGLDEGTRRGAAESAAAMVNRFAEEELLCYTVCDPAMGSGHFLVDAANQMTGVLMSLLAEVPRVDGMKCAVSNSPNVWRRRITRHCLYGVDLNFLAVNLAKLSLWLNCFASEHKLTFLDHHLRCGNSLIGIRDLADLKRIPKRKKDGKKDESPTLFNTADLSAAFKTAAGGVAGIATMDEDDTDRQRAALHGAEESLARTRPLADLYTAYLMNPGLTTDEYRQLFQLLAKGEDVGSSFNLGLPQTMKVVEDLSKRHDYFHWPLAFPEVFGPESAGGFNATVGNPPWGVLQPDTIEFFSPYNIEIKVLKDEDLSSAVYEIINGNPEIYRKWEHHKKHIGEEADYCKEYSVYPTMQSGKTDLYRIFSEQVYYLTKDRGCIGIVIPSGFYTDKWATAVRMLYLEHTSITTFFAFENRWPILFPAVDGRYKIVPMTTVKGTSTTQFKASFMCHNPDMLSAIEKQCFLLDTKIIKQFSPETMSFFEFENPAQLVVAKKISSAGPMIIEKENGWHPQPMIEFKFNAHQQKLPFLRDRTGFPLLEGKMIWQYDLHYASWDEEKSDYEANNNTSSQVLNPKFTIREASAVSNFIERDNFAGGNEYDYKLYRIGFRDVAASSNERAAVATIIPPNVFCVETVKIFRPLPILRLLFTIGVWNSFVFDFYARLKVGLHFNYHDIETFPFPRPKDDTSILQMIAWRAGRLVATTDYFSALWVDLSSKIKSEELFKSNNKDKIFEYGPAHEQEIRKRLRDEAASLTPEWGPHCGVHDRLPDRRDTGDRAQLRAEIDAYVAHLYGLSRDDFAYILDTFPVLKSKEKKAFGEFMSKRKCLEEFDRIEKVLGNA